MTSNVLEQASTPAETANHATQENPFAPRSIRVSDEALQRALEHLMQLKNARNLA